MSEADDRGTAPRSARTRPDPRSSLVPSIISDAEPAVAYVHVRNPTLTLTWRDGVFVLLQTEMARRPTRFIRYLGRSLAMGKPRKNDSPVEKETHGLPAAFIASAYFSSRPYLEAQVV